MVYSRLPVYWKLIPTSVFILITEKSSLIFREIYIQVNLTYQIEHTINFKNMYVKNMLLTLLFCSDNAL